MSNSSEVKEDFETYGIVIQCSKALNKCVQLCKEYNLSSEQIAVLWLDFSSDQNHDQLNLDILEKFENAKLKKDLTKVQDNETHNNNKDIQKPHSSQSIYTASTIQLFKSRCDAEDSILAAYGASPSMPKDEESPRTPNSSYKRGTPKAKRDLAFQNSLERAQHSLLPSSPLSPACSSPSLKYSSRNNSGQAVCTFGQDVESATWRADFSDTQIQVIECPCGGDAPLISPYRYMYEKLRDSGEVLDDFILYLGDQLKEQLNVEEWTRFHVPNNVAVWCVGRICCDSVGRLNSASVILEGSREQRAETICVDLSKLSSYSLFPGQIVAIKGNNPDGRKLMANEILQGKIPTPPELPLDSICDLQIRIASGPFTTNDNLLFEPLNDFLSLITENPPHVLILLGPLLDSSHPLLDTLNDSYDSVVTKCLLKISTRLQETETKVFIASSSRDVTCPQIYPTPPVFLNGSVPPSGGGQVKILPDPCLLNFNGFIVGITATDILMHVSKEEISFPPQSGDRLARLSQHLLLQQSFYPLYPPPENFSMHLEQADIHARLPVKPHMLVLPSDFRGFIKDVSDCVIVNPERLAKGTVGGSFAQLEISSPKTGSKRPSINGKIVKI